MESNFLFLQSHVYIYKNGQYIPDTKKNCHKKISVLEFLIDEIFAMLDRRVFQQRVDIPMGTNYAPFIAYLFLYSHDRDIILGLLKKSEKETSRILLFNVPLIQMMSFH